MELLASKEERRGFGVDAGGDTVSQSSERTRKMEVIERDFHHSGLVTCQRDWPIMDRIGPDVVHKVGDAKPLLCCCEMQPSLGSHPPATCSYACGPDI